jgi:hypothetical protein
MDTTDVDTSKTIEFPTVMHKRMAEGALKRDAELTIREQIAAEVLRLDNRSRARNLYDFGGKSWLVEVAGGPFPGAVWTVVFEGNRTNTWFASMDVAALYVIERRNGGGHDPRGYEYAARVLNVPTAPKEG